jgi:tripartite-type tricarboxylate transporter receptor subunit TctC
MKAGVLGLYASYWHGLWVPKGTPIKRLNSAVQDASAVATVQQRFADQGQDMAGELFKLMAGVELMHVPYRGSPPALTDLLAGQLQLMFSPPPSISRVCQVR